MGEKYKSLNAKTRFLLLNEIGKNLKSEDGGKVKYLNGVNDHMIARKYDVHVTTVARSRRDVFGELVRGPNGPHKKKKAAATDPAVLDLLDSLKIRIEDMSYKLDTLTKAIAVQPPIRGIGQPSYEAAKNPAPVRKYKPAPGTGYYREETEEDKPASYVK